MTREWVTVNPNTAGSWLVRQGAGEYYLVRQRAGAVLEAGLTGGGGWVVATQPRGRVQSASRECVASAGAAAVEGWRLKGAGARKPAGSGGLGAC